MFSRKKTDFYESVQVQESYLDLGNEVLISNPPLQLETVSHMNNDNQDLPTTIQKGLFILSHASCPLNMHCALIELSLLV